MPVHPGFYFTNSSVDPKTFFNQISVISEQGSMKGCLGGSFGKVGQWTNDTCQGHLVELDWEGLATNCNGDLVPSQTSIALCIDKQKISPFSNTPCRSEKCKVISFSSLIRKEVSRRVEDHITYAASNHTFSAFCKQDWLRDKGEDVGHRELLCKSTHSSESVLSAVSIGVPNIIELFTEQQIRTA